MTSEENHILNEPGMNYRKIIVIVIIFLILSVAILVIWFSRAEDSRELAPDFSLVDIDGHDFTLSESKGKISILNSLSICNKLYV